ncbi:MAG: hypothetical protein C5B54_05840 [Acidobacteria bacterium]|nr:MAG: hypothetical protein C5B54_05840 [Acidobacteriota bacterium]
MKSKPGEVLTFRYKFNFENGVAKEFAVELDKTTLGLINQPREDHPDWTKLEFNKCPNCPLDSKVHPHCPIAINISDLIAFFKDLISYEKTYMAIETDSRTYIGKVSLQEGIKSLIGLYMVSSGCPVMDKLRPMVLIHAPFPTLRESIYKLISMYLLAQYFAKREGKEPDWSLKRLIELCNDIQVVNRSFFKRVREVKVKDASLNALVALDSFAVYTASSIEDDNLDEIRALFKAFLEEGKK